MNTPLLQEEPAADMPERACDTAHELSAQDLCRRDIRTALGTLRKVTQETEQKPNDADTSALFDAFYKVHHTRSCMTHLHAELEPTLHDVLQKIVSCALDEMKRLVLGRVNPHDYSDAQSFVDLAQQYSYTLSEDEKKELETMKDHSRKLSLHAAYSKAHEHHQKWQDAYSYHTLCVLRNACVESGIIVST